MEAATTTTPSPGFAPRAPAASRLTSVRTEVGWFAFWPALAAIAALAGFATRNPTSSEILVMVGAALVPWTVFLLWLVNIRGRLRHTFHEPLDDHPRAPARSAALRGALPLGGMAPAMLTLMTGTSISDGGTRALFAGFILGIALGSSSTLSFVIRAERAVGGRLLYARRRSRDNLWIDQRALSKRVVYLVDDPDPERWGEQRV